MELSFIFKSLLNGPCTHIHHFGCPDSNRFIFPKLFNGTCPAWFPQTFYKWDYLLFLVILFANLKRLRWVVCSWKYFPVDSGTPEIAQYILIFLDYNDLKNAERVCKLWYHVIRDGKIWKRCLEKVCTVIIALFFSRNFYKSYLFLFFRCFTILLYGIYTVAVMHFLVSLIPWPFKSETYSFSKWPVIL